MAGGQVKAGQYLLVESVGVDTLEGVDHYIHARIGHQ